MKKLLLFCAFFISLNTLAGPQYFKYDNGDVELIQNVENNKREGNYIMVNSDKGVKEEGTYKNDKKEGPYKRSFRDGDIEKGNYTNDNAEGPYKYYFKNGSIEEGTYKNGQRIK